MASFHLNLIDGLSLAGAALGVMLLLAYGVSMLRTKQRTLLGALAVFVASAVFITAGIGLHFFNQATDSVFQAVAANKKLPPLPHDWGSNFSAEDRTRYSLGMAQSEYVQRGILREYIDLTVSRQTFTPGESDQLGRQQYIENIESIRKIGKFTEWSIYGLFLLYGFGIALGLSHRWQHIVALPLR